jgi:hypothetical protein
MPSKPLLDRAGRIDREFRRRLHCIDEKYALHTGGWHILNGNRRDIPCWMVNGAMNIIRAGGAGDTHSRIWPIFTSFS